MRFRLLAIVVAVVLAVIGVAAVLVYVRQANVRAVSGLKAETVIAAAGSVAAGTTVAQASSEHLLKTEDLPVSSLAGAGTPVHSVNTATGPMVVTSALTAGEVLFTDMLAPAGSSPPTQGDLAVPPGKYAVSLDVCIPEDVAGYVTPGMDVAVFDVVVPPSAATQAPSCSPAHDALDGRGLGGLTADLVLGSAQVLRVGQSPASEGNTASSPAESPSSSSGDVLVTLAVSLAQASEVMVLQQAGIPYLAVPGPDASAG